MSEETVTEIAMNPAEVRKGDILTISGSAVNDSGWFRGWVVMATTGNGVTILQENWLHALLRHARHPVRAFKEWRR